MQAEYIEIKATTKLWKKILQEFEIVINFLPLINTTAILVIRNQYADLACEALYSYNFLQSKQDTYGTHEQIILQRTEQCKDNEQQNNLLQDKQLHPPLVTIYITFTFDYTTL